MIGKANVCRRLQMLCLYESRLMVGTPSIYSLDPIDKKKKQEAGLFKRLLMTRYYKGKAIKKMQPFGHYMFCGPQGSGKTSSVLWYAEKLAKKYKRKKHTIQFYSNIGLGKPLNKNMIFETINAFNPDDKEIRIVIIDEIHTYFPSGLPDKATKKIRDDLIAVFSQLRKRSTFILSTAQIYGRLDKSLREQCMYMIDCHVNWNNKLVNEFIPEKDILCDSLGRWAGSPRHIYVHGLPTLHYDTKRIIRD